MSFPDEDKLGSKLHTRPFLDTISTIPIKKRRIFFSKSPSPPPETPPSSTTDYGTTQSKSPCLAQVPGLEAGDIRTPLSNLSDNISSLKPGFKILDVDINKPPQYQGLIVHDCNDMEQVENELKDTFYDEKVVSLKKAEPLAPVTLIDLPMAENKLDVENISNELFAAEKLSGNTELQHKETIEKFRIIDACSVRQELFELQDPSSKDNERQNVHDAVKKSPAFGPIVLGPTYRRRSNWDLNMTMDTWAESSSDSTVKGEECDGNREPGVSCHLGRVPLTNLIDARATSKEPNLSQPMVGEHFISNPCLSHYTSPECGPAFYNSEIEACLDLCLKPSFMPESFGNPFNFKKVDSLKEMKFLSMTMKSASSTLAPIFLGFGAMKPDPHGCIRHVEKKTDFSIAETLVMKPIKFESCEIGETSRITVSGAANFSSDAAIKPEPVEDRDQTNDFAAVNETGSYPENAHTYNLLQTAKIPMEGFGTRIMGSNTKSDPFIKSVILQTPIEYPNMHKYKVNCMGQEKQARSLAVEGRELISIKQASNVGTEHTGFFIKCRLEAGQNMKLLSESCEQDSAAVDLLCGSSDETLNVVSSMNLSETDIKAGSGAETYLNCVHTPREYPGTSKCEGDIMGQVKQVTGVYRDKERCHSTMSDVNNLPQPEIGFALQSSVTEGMIFISTKDASKEGSEHNGFVIECQLEEAQNSKLSESCEHVDIAVDFMQGSSDVKTEASHINETDKKIGPGVEAYQNCDVLEFDQANNELICMMEEQGDSECQPENSHSIDGVMHAVHENGGIVHNYEDGELRDGASLSANGGSHLTIEIEKAEDVCPRGLLDVPVDMSSSHEHVKHMTIESPDMYADPGTVECFSDIDPAIAADLQESSSVTGDSSGKKASRTTPKVPRDCLMKGNVNNRAEDSGVMENAEGSFKSSFTLSGDPKRDALDRIRSGRIINLNSTSSRNLKHIHEGPLSTRVESEKHAYKLLMRERCSGRSRDQVPNEMFHKTEDENRSGWTSRKHESGSIHRIRKGSELQHSRIRGEPKIDQFSERNSDLSYIREQIHDHDDFRFSRSIPSSEVSMNSISDVYTPFAGRISRKVTNELQNHARILSRRHSPGGPKQMPLTHRSTSEISPIRCTRRDAPDLVYDYQETNCRTFPRGHFERTDRIPIHRKRLSLSPSRRRGTPQLSPVISPSWSPHTPSDGLTGRSGAPIVMQESMRSNRQRFTEDILARRRGSGYQAKLSDNSIEVASSSREFDFPRSERDFPRKINKTRQFPGEYYGSTFSRSQFREHDSENATRRKYNEAHETVRYRQRCIEEDDDEKKFTFNAEEGPPRSYRYDADGSRGFNEGGSSREVERHFKNRIGNSSKRYRHIEQQHHEDDFRHHQAEQGWNDSGFSNARPRSRRY